MLLLFKNSLKVDKVAVLAFGILVSLLVSMCSWRCSHPCNHWSKRSSRSGSGVAVDLEYPGKRGRKQMLHGWQ